MSTFYPLVTVNGKKMELPLGYALKNNPVWYGERGVFGGGYHSNANINDIDYITIVTTGNATDFGDLTLARSLLGAVSNSTRGAFGGGNQNIIDYITIASTGNAIDFGDLTISTSGDVGCSNGTRGIFAGEYMVNIISYITISTAGNAIDFGDLTYGRASMGGVSNAVRGVFGGGYNNLVNIIEYVTISTTGNAVDFGDLTNNRGYISACSSLVRGVFSGGTDYSDRIDYITVASAGNATDFGNQISEIGGYYQKNSSCSNSVRGIIAGEYMGESYKSNIIQYITIATTGDATDFGDLSAAKGSMAACSGN